VRFVILIKNAYSLMRCGVGSIAKSKIGPKRLLANNTPPPARRVQITTDALRRYANVIEDAFGSQTDYAQLHKVYGARLEERLAVPRRNASGGR
jgi:hypothetical protein